MDDTYRSDTSAATSRNGHAFAHHSNSASEYGHELTNMQAASCAAQPRRTVKTVTETTGRAPSLQTSAELVHTYGAIADAVTATILNAQAGLDWLRAQPPNLEEVRRTLNSIANDAKRTGELVVRLRVLPQEGTAADGVLDLS